VTMLDVKLRPDRMYDIDKEKENESSIVVLAGRVARSFCTFL